MFSMFLLLTKKSVFETKREIDIFENINHFNYIFSGMYMNLSLNKGS